MACSRCGGYYSCHCDLLDMEEELRVKKLEVEVLEHRIRDRRKEVESGDQPTPKKSDLKCTCGGPVVPVCTIFKCKKCHGEFHGAPPENCSEEYYVAAGEENQSFTQSHKDPLVVGSKVTVSEKVPFSDIEIRPGAVGKVLSISDDLAVVEFKLCHEIFKVVRFGERTRHVLVKMKKHPPDRVI